MNPSKRLLPFHSSDAVLALFVVTITAMLLVSLPTALIDFLLACNLGFSLLLLLVALYVPNSLALLAFPSLLLLSTLFRLGLNVASTRLILLQGDAGDVIQAFGDFLIQGEIVVGILIFIIITVVNYVVVARGSSRVAEVAARFTLDALPGKQMAIDAELRSGLISADQAQNKRDKLRQESQLYGAMDGAMKFVQGDVVAGFFIIVVNMLGGLYLGVSRGLSLPDAISTYTTLTVGDGLVSQIPALLISICAGIVVTRVVSSEGTTLGVDLGRQLFGTTETVFIAGLLLIGVGMLPGLPPLPFFVVGGVTLLVGIYLVRSNEREVGDLAHSDLVGPSSDALRTAKLVVSLDDQMLYSLYSMNQEHYAARWQNLTRSLRDSSGVLVPQPYIVRDRDLPHSSFRLAVRGSILAEERPPLDSIMVECHPDHAEILGLEIAQQAQHPLTSAEVFWTPLNPRARGVLEAGEIRSFDFLEYIFLLVYRFYKRYPDEVISLSEVLNEVSELRETQPALVEEVMGKELVDYPRLTRIVQALVQEGVSIRSMQSILEMLAAYHAQRSDEEDFFSLSDIVNFIRRKRVRYLLSPSFTQRGSVKVVRVGDSVHVAVARGFNVESERVSLPAAVTDRLKSSLQTLIEPVRLRGVYNLAVLCDEGYRDQIHRFLSDQFESLPSISAVDLPAGIALEEVGVWQI